MNANELADELDNMLNAIGLTDNRVPTMLRQQQAEIEALKQSKSDGNNKVNSELTDDEIYACFHQYFVLGEPKPTHYELEYEDLIEFAKAILLKASEK